MNNTLNECPFNIGKMINDFITSNGISIESAALKSKMDVDEFRNILNEPSMKTDVIKRISVALKHNFMADIAEIVEKEITDC